jgi:hypothetical protein
LTATNEPQTHIPWFPTDYIFACINSSAGAASAARKLREAGFHAEEVKYLSGDEALERIEIECEHCNLVQRVLRFIWKAFTDEGTIMDELAQEARAGHAIVAVHVPSQDKVDEAYQILAEYDAHRVEYWGHHGTMTHLSRV